MPYIAVELDALNEATNIARGGSITEDAAIAGLNRLWARCFRKQSDRVTTGEIAGLFGGDGLRVCLALLEFGFLAEMEDGTWRVRGAHRYLRLQEAVTEGRRKGGLAAKGNLIPGARHRKSAERSSSAPLSREPAESQPITPSADDGLLSPNTEHRTPNTEERSYKSASPPTEALFALEPVAQDKSRSTSTSENAVFAHWCQVLEKRGAKFTEERREAVRARLREGYTVEQLKQAIDGCSKTPHNMGQNDRGTRFDDLELICRSGSHVERFIANALAPPSQSRAPPDVRKGHVRAEDFDGKHTGGFGF